MPTLTLRPDSTVALGSWTVVGAATAHQALLDAADSSYVQVTTRAMLDTQILRLEVDDLALPSGAKIHSVRTRVRIQQAVVGAPRPRCVGWHRCRKPRNIITAIILLIFRLLFRWRCPGKVTPSDPDWVDQELEYLPLDPEGQEWTEESFNDYEVQLARDDADGGALRISAVYVDVDYSNQPTVDATAPTGTVTDTARPTVKWTYADTASDRQQAFLVRLFTSGMVAAPGFDPLTSLAIDESGWVLSDAQEWTGNVDLVNNLVGETYVAYVQVEKVWDGVGVFRSAVDSTSWTQNVAGAPTPLVVAATFEADTNRVRLTVQPSAGTPATVAYTVETSRDFGQTWAYVYGARQVPADGVNPVTVYDYAAPLNTESRYRVLAFRELGGLRYPSGYSAEATVVPVVDGEVWLKDVAAPNLSMRLPVAAEGNDEPSQPRQWASFSVLTDEAVGGVAYKVAVSGPLEGREGSLHLIFHEKQDADLWAAFQAIRVSGRTLLLQWPTGDQLWASLGSGLSWRWELRGNNVRWRRAQIDYTEVRQPEESS